MSRNARQLGVLRRRNVGVDVCEGERSRWCEGGCVWVWEEGEEGMELGGEEVGEEGEFVVVGGVAGEFEGGYRGS